MDKYDGYENLGTRMRSLYEYGYDSSVWGEFEPPEKGHVIEIVGPYYVSKPCWKEVCEAADLTDTEIIDINKFVDWEDSSEKVSVQQFFFVSIEAARKMALRVQKSAKNIRKDDIRRVRLYVAGGFHNKGVLKKLFEIQKGRCYYSGDPLIEKPKNFVIDHIQSIYSGGTDWPDNLALVIKKINTWKGGHSSSEETLMWLAKKRGENWFRKQKAYCEEVDCRRKELDVRFRLQCENAS